MTELKIEYRDPASLEPSPFNSRLHSEKQILQIANSLKQFGFNKPVAIDENGVIIAGHGTVLGARKAKIKSIPVVVLTHLDERQKRAYIIADNKLGLNSEWDFEKLSAEVAALTVTEFDINMLGFNDHELDAILKNEPFIPETTTVTSHERTKHKGDDDDAPAEKIQYGVFVVCDDEPAQKRILKALKKDGYICKKMVN